MAPTLGYSRTTRAPDEPTSPSATIVPWLSSIRAPSSRSPRRCMSIGRSPKSSPPGMAIRASPHRASSAPSRAVDARICSTSWYGASGMMSPVESIRSVARSPHVDLEPSAESASAIHSTSLMRGTLRSTNSPGASTVATISLSTEFFAPEIGNLAAQRTGRVGRSARSWRQVCSSAQPTVDPASRPVRRRPCP